MSKDNDQNEKREEISLLSTVKARLIITTVALVAIPLIIAIAVSYRSSMNRGLKDAEEINSRQCTIV